MDVCSLSKLFQVSFISKGKPLRYRSRTKATSVIFETQMTTDPCFWVTHIFCLLRPWITWTSCIMSRGESGICTILGHKHLRLETIYNVYTVNKNSRLLLLNERNISHDISRAFYVQLNELRELESISFSLYCLCSNQSHCVTRHTW